MDQIVFIYIAISQQKWNNTYLESAYKLRGGNVANYCFQDKELTRIRIFKFFYINVPLNYVEITFYC